MAGFRDLPQRLRVRRGAVVVGIQVFAPSATTGVDQEERPRRDARDESVERRRRLRARERRQRGRLDRISRDHEPAARPADQVLANRACAGALGDDRAQTSVRRGGLQHHLAADREAHAAHTAVLDVGPLAAARRRPRRRPWRRPSRRRSDRRRSRRSRARPGGGRRSRAARASAPAASLPAARRVRDDGRAVPRRDVPAGEIEAVARAQGHLLVRAARGRAGATAARGRCVARIATAIGKTTQ